MVIQVSNNPLVIKFNANVEDLTELVVSLWDKSKSVDNGRFLRSWRKADMTISGDTAVIPMTEQFTQAKSIAANTFANCYKLQTLIMRRTSVTTCANVSAFLNTPIRGRNSLTAQIYVPSALIESYKAASVWKTIDGYGYVEWLPIEGSEWEL